MAINTLYLDNGILKSARNIYNRQNPKNIKLDNFFQKPVFELLQKKLNNQKYALKFHPYKYKYGAAKLKEINAFVNGMYFKDLIKSILQFKKYKITYEVRKFEAGNYTLLHDAEKEKYGIDFFIDFSKDKKNFGGYAVYLNEKEELLALNTHPNSLSFIQRKKGVIKFTKYVIHRQKNPIVQVVGTIFKQ